MNLEAQNGFTQTKRFSFESRSFRMGSKIPMAAIGGVTLPGGVTHSTGSVHSEGRPMKYPAGTARTCAQ